MKYIPWILCIALIGCLNDPPKDTVYAVQCDTVDSVVYHDSTGLTSLHGTCTMGDDPQPPGVPK